MYEDDWLEAAYEEKFEIPDEVRDDLFDTGYYDEEYDDDDEA